jgi:hypothetical protein
MMMKRLLLALVVSAAAAVAAATPALGDPNPSALSFAVCSRITQPYYPQPPAPVPFSCGQPAYPAGLDSNCQPFPANTDLGSFSLPDNPLGVIVHIFIPNMLDPSGLCILGAGAGFAQDDLHVTVTDVASGSSFTVIGSSGPYSVAIVPLHHGLPPGTYSITVDFLGGLTCSPGSPCSSWLPASMTGTLVVTRHP